jgi:hypothetical protein
MSMIITNNEDRATAFLALLVVHVRFAASGNLTTIKRSIDIIARNKLDKIPNDKPK